MILRSGAGDDDGVVGVVLDVLADHGEDEVLQGSEFAGCAGPKNNLPGDGACDGNAIIDGKRIYGVEHSFGKDDRASG